MYLSPHYYGTLSKQCILELINSIRIYQDSKKMGTVPLNNTLFISYSE